MVIGLGIIGKIFNRALNIIENNLITNNRDGIDIEGPNTLLNNTIENNYVGIQQVTNFEFPTVAYNNIQNNSYNFFLYQSVTGNVNATYNYWGTTNQTAISNLICHNKDESSFRHGKLFSLSDGTKPTGAKLKHVVTNTYSSRVSIVIGSFNAIHRSISVLCDFGAGKKA
jgi:parallel beta-helix repeat protein